jgi:hypothetical protein
LAGDPCLHDPTRCRFPGPGAAPEIDRAKAALDAQRKAIDALPAALLREVFGSSRPDVEAS